MTALKKALNKAGIKSDAERLSDMAKAALKVHPHDLNLAMSALFLSVIGDTHLTATVFRPYADEALGDYIREHLPAQAGSRLGQQVPEAHFPDARSATHPSKDGGGGQPHCGNHTNAAPAINPPRVSASVIGRIHRALLLDEIMPNGKRFRDCTKSELEGMGKSLGRKSHRCIAVAAQLTAAGQTPEDAGITEAELRRVDAAWNGE